MMSMHVSSVCRAAYCFLCQLRQVVRSVSVDAAKTSSPCIQFISTSCWYCNLSSIRISDILLRYLQAARNAVARLVTGTRRCDHITPVLQQLHWLPVRQRVEFKLAVVRSTTWRHQICQMIASSLSPPGGRRQLRSSDNFKCTIMQLYQFTS